MLVSGFATPSATQPKNLDTPFGSRRRKLHGGENAPWVSAVGFGSYRIGFSPALGAPESAEALELSLRRGMNLIDTSANYGNGQSELLIGRTLARLFEEKALAREGVVVITKAGYIQGNNMELAKKRVVEGRPFSDVVEFGSEVWHCMHPDFLRDQVDRSRERLGLATLDVLLLHNPEYALKKFEMDGMDPARARAVFDDRLARAFACCEELVAEGKIVAYGLSSNTLGMPAEDPAHVNLRRCVELAGPNFRVAQLPLNWIELAPTVFPVEADPRADVSKGTGRNTLQFAREKGIGLLVNRPFNAMHDGGLIRLTRPHVPEGVTLDDGAKRGLANWTALARDMESLAKRHIDLPGYEDAPLSQFVLCTLLWQPGIVSVLAGVRKKRYVADAEQAVARPALLMAANLLAAIYGELEFHRDSPV